MQFQNKKSLLSAEESASSIPEKISNTDILPQGLTENNLYCFYILKKKKNLDIKKIFLTEVNTYVGIFF